MTSTGRVTLESAFVLHSRAYRNSSLIVELFTRSYGRMAVVARSARGPRSRYQGNLQLFTPLLVSWTGRSELKTLGNIELSGLGYQLEGKALLCGFYLNELLMRLMGHEDPYINLFECYQTTLINFERGGVIESDIRYFEKRLLQELGYGIPLNEDITTGQRLHPDCFYRYLPARGFVLCDPSDEVSVFPGYVLIAFDNETLESADDNKRIKVLMRLVLSRHLGERPIFTRELLV